MTLKNKVAVVTGGNDGIGRHIVLKLAAEGVQIAAIGRNTERLTVVEQEAIKAGSPKAKSYVCDLRSLSMIKEVVGMVTGNGFTAKTKPYSFGASTVADKHV